MWRVIILGLLGSAAVALSGCAGEGDDVSSGDGTASIATEAEGQDASLSLRELIPLLTRYGVGPGEAGIDLTYAPEAFFEIAGLEPPPEMSSRPTLAFIMQETVHEGELPIEPPSVFLELEAGDRVPPYSAQVTAEDPHHRTVRLLFPQAGGATGEGDTLRVVVPMNDGTVSAGNAFVWQLPIDLRGDTNEKVEG